MRITEKMLQIRINNLNKLTGNPTAGSYTGTYFLYLEYEGYALKQIINMLGGVSIVLRGGTRRELMGKLDAYIAGIEKNISSKCQKCVENNSCGTCGDLSVGLLDNGLCPTCNKYKE